MASKTGDVFFFTCYLFNQMNEMFLISFQIGLLELHNSEVWTVLLFECYMIKMNITPLVSKLLNIRFLR